MTTITKLKVKTPKTVEKLTDAKKKKIDEVFNKASSFSDLGNKIIAPLENVLEDSSDLLEKNPIFKASEELGEMNEGMNNIYNNLVKTDGRILSVIKSVPLVGDMVSKISNSLRETNFNLKSIKGQLSSIFSGYDEVYGAVIIGKKLQGTFINTLSENIDNLNDYIKYFDLKIEEFEKKRSLEKEEFKRDKYKLFLENIGYYRNNLEVLNQNLIISRKRLLMDLDSSTKMAITMETAKPIYSGLIASVVTERVTAKATNVAQKIMGKMTEDIERMLREQTSTSIKSHKKAQELNSKTVISSKVLEENVLELKEYFDKMGEYKEKLLENSDSNRKILYKTKGLLEQMTISTVKEQEQLESIYKLKA